MSNDRRLARATDELSRQLEAWRETHRPPTPIPPDLWDRAVELAAEQGIGPTARALRLDYGALKRRVEPGVCEPTALSPAQFVEWIAPLPNHVAECALEVVSARGARLRVELRNVAASGLASIIREFAG